jgi:hypothetical protein
MNDHEQCIHDHELMSTKLRTHACGIEITLPRLHKKGQIGRIGSL